MSPFFLYCFYTHMLIGKVWIYRLLFVCLFGWLVVCVFVRLRISPPRIKLAASNFARWFIGVLGRESPILWNFAFPEAPPEAQNRTNRLSRPRCGAMVQACAWATRRIGMCGYTAVSEDRCTCSFF